MRYKLLGIFIIFLLILPLLILLFSKNETLLEIPYRFLPSQTRETQETYTINGTTPIEFEFNSSLQRYTPPFHYSEAFQKFLNGISVSFDEVLGTKNVFPKKISISITDKFVQTPLTTYSETGKPLFSHAYSYDRPKDMLTIVITFSNLGLYDKTTSNFSTSQRISREILYSLLYFAELYPAKKYTENVSSYLNAESAEQLL